MRPMFQALLAGLALATALTFSSPSLAQPGDAPAAAPAKAAVAKVDNPYGLQALWTQSDAVAKSVLVILALMSMGSWYVIVTKLLEQGRMGRQAKKAEQEFWNAGTVETGAGKLADGSPFRFIAEAAWRRRASTADCTRRSTSPTGSISRSTAPPSACSGDCPTA